MKYEIRATRIISIYYNYIYNLSPAGLRSVNVPEQRFPIFFHVGTPKIIFFYIPTRIPTYKKETKKNIQLLANIYTLTSQTAKQKFMQ